MNIIINKKSKKSAYFKWTYGLSGNDYKVTTLPKLFIIGIRIISQSLKSIGNSDMSKLTKRASYWRTDPDYRKDSPLKRVMKSKRRRKALKFVLSLQQLLYFTSS